jgi:thioredoxin-dependent peroxiredoxin
MKFRNTIFLITLISLISMNNLSAQGSEPLKKGDKAPVFTAVDDNNKTWNISKHLGKKNIIVYFYPAAMTGGCTNQACAYRDKSDELEKENAIVVGISGDEVENLKVFKDAHNLNFTLLSDNDGDIARKFGVPLSAGNSIKREIDGKEITLQRGVTAKRWTFIINTEGEIAYVNQDVNAANDSEEVLKVLRGQL